MLEMDEEDKDLHKSACEKMEKDIKKMNKTNLYSLKKHRLNLENTSKKIDKLLSIFKYEPPSSSLFKKTFSINKKTVSNFYKPASTANTFYTRSNNQNFLKTQKNFLPNLQNSHEINVHDRMRSYKVVFKKRKCLLPEEKIKKFLGKSGFSIMPSHLYKALKKMKDEYNDSKKNNINLNAKNYNDENKEFGESTKTNLNIKDINTNRAKNKEKDKKKILVPRLQNKKMNFEDYLRMQSKAEIKLKPKLGDSSNDLVNYINAIQGIRETIVNDFMDEIKNTENRYNREKPEIDANLLVKDKVLNVHKWKNLFSLRDYQNFYLDNLKGKISDVNYRQMQKIFRQISLICFSEGNIGAIKKFNYNFAE